MDTDARAVSRVLERVAGFACRGGTSGPWPRRRSGSPSIAEHEATARSADSANGTGPGDFPWINTSPRQQYRAAATDAHQKRSAIGHQHHPQVYADPEGHSGLLRSKSQPGNTADRVAPRSSEAHLFARLPRMCNLRQPKFPSRKQEFATTSSTFSGNPLERSARVLAYRWVSAYSFSADAVLEPGPGLCGIYTGDAFRCPILQKKQSFALIIVPLPEEDRLILNTINYHCKRKRLFDDGVDPDITV